jgi:2-polyprenyl-3-methyl-5-hydroxy-6-metoxy-1,4-benzoquinol methylase
MTTGKTDTLTDPRPPGYAFSNSAPQAVDQLTTIEAYLDPLTVTCLEAVDLRPGARCLEIGAGGGSIAHWLADRVGPAGQVVAVDQDTSRLAPAVNLEIVQHDLRHGVPVAGPFHLIHARLVLLHLPFRRRLLRELAERLAPGGWLVVGEFSRQPLEVLTADTPADAELFTTVIDTLITVLEQGHGADLDWAHQARTAMAEVGLCHVHTVEHAETWIGGGPGCRLHQVNSRQKQAALIDAGLTAAELDRFRQIVSDPAFSARSWQFVGTRGQRRAGPLSVV